jgi:lysophospholipase L1-like esterase
MHFRYRIVVILIALPVALLAQVKEPPFWSEIRNFKKSDSISFPVPDQILFVGSSSFRLWNDLQNYFPKHPIINRGFGGATLKDLNFYFKDIIKPYHAKQIVVYCGDNDFANDNTLTIDSVVKRFETLFNKIRAADAKVKITFISIKPSPSRKMLAPKFGETNNRILQFLKKQKNTSFVDVYHKMLDERGLPLRNIFLPDSLHMNPQGYAIWQKEIEPHLLSK